MKSILIKVLVLIPLFAFSQQKNSIGIHLLHTSETGLTSNLQYQRYLTDKDAMRFEIGGDFQKGINNYNYKLGYTRNILSSGMFEFWAGVEYKFEQRDLRRFDRGVVEYKTLGLSLESKFNLTDRLSLYTGFTIPVKKFGPTVYKSEIIDLRLGISYKF